MERNNGEFYLFCLSVIEYRLKNGLHVIPVSRGYYTTTPWLRRFLRGSGGRVGAVNSGYYYVELDTESAAYCLRRTQLLLGLSGNPTTFIPNNVSKIRRVWDAVLRICR